jgi:O-antigen/teichoic acid export membrane protein
MRKLPMKETSSHINYSGSLIAKNTVYNLLGYGIPLIFAIILIPPLIKGLGEERFGLLNLAWIIIGYFSFLDFGIGRAVTKVIAEKIGTGILEEIPRIFWTSIYLVLIISSVGALIAFLLTPLMVNDFFNITAELQNEALNTFYLLALSIPIVATTAGLRGLLEAYQKFSIINVIRTFLGIFSFVGPLLCLIITDNLFWIVFLLIVIRIIVWLLYLIQCFKLNLELKTKIRFQSNLIKPILKLSGWISIANVIVPLLIYLDRFLIGAIISATAITYYATPYEVISKLSLIPGALTAVLFPAFSASYSNDLEFVKKISFRSVKYIFFLLFPVILFILTFAYNGLNFWLGEKFALSSTLVLQLLSVGILFNSLAYVPFSLLQGIGKADIVAKLQLIELPIYLVVMWLAISNFGIDGAAFIWMLRMVVDASLLFWLTEKVSPVTYLGFKMKGKHIFMLLIILISIIPTIIPDLRLKFIFMFVILPSFVILVWKYFLDKAEKDFLFSLIKR